MNSPVRSKGPSPFNWNAYYAVCTKLERNPALRDFSRVPSPAPSRASASSSSASATPPFPHPLDPLEYFREYGLSKLSELCMACGKRSYCDLIQDPRYWRAEAEHW